MPAEFFALASAFFFALNHILTKKGLKYSNPPTAVLTSLAVNVAILWGFSLLFLPVRLLTLSGVLIFVIVGLYDGVGEWLVASVADTMRNAGGAKHR